MGLGLLSGAVLAVATAGCGGGSATPECQPACPAGYLCTEAGCERDPGAGGGRDLSASTVDGGDACGGLCGGSAPWCNDKGLCVPCLSNDHCPPGNVCRPLGATSACVPGCDKDARCGGGAMKCCGGACVDTSRDDRHCGACDAACQAPHAAAHCVAGSCQGLACAPGWGDCNADAKDGCETNVRTDTSHCGACGMPCAPAHATAGCANTCYIAGCEYGYADCDQQPGDGCEVPVLADTKNCGACGNVCVAVPRAQVGCVAGACSILACSAGFADCNGLEQDGCEVATSVDRTNCGACGNVCNPGLICVNGGCTCAPCSFPNAKAACVNFQCAIASCNSGWADCDGKPANGCETNVATDGRNCGSCGTVCAQNLVCAAGGCTCPQCNIPNAKSKCINLMCAFDQCLPDFADCNKNLADGCEIDLANDPKNCSACGKACNQGDFCVAGACVNIPLTLVTDNTWKQTLNVANGWEQPGYNDAGWDPAIDQGANGTAPWGNLNAFNGSSARWIWYYDSRQGGDLSTVYFRKGFTAVQANMTLVITADNVYTAYIDGVQVAQSFDVWSSVKSFPIVLTPGKKSVMAVLVTNQGGPGGLILDMH